MTKIKVIDALMGAGKTTHAIDKFNDQTQILKRFIYATPKLVEIEQVAERITLRNFEIPDQARGKGSKVTHFMRLVEEGRDIITTHSLLDRLTEEQLDIVAAQGYELVIDEVPDVYESFVIDERDKKIARLAGLVAIDEETHEIKWIADDYSQHGVFNELKEFLSGDRLFYSDNTNAIVSLRKSNFFNAFASTTILTYMFDCSIARSYFDFMRVDYKIYSLKNGELVDYDAKLENRRELYELIEIKKSRKVGEGYHDLSTNYLKKNATGDIIEQIKKEMYAFSRYKGTKQTQIIWTCKSDFENTFAQKGYAKSYIAYTERATNVYRDKDVLMFIGNRFMNPNDAAFFTKRGVRIEQDAWAVSELLQWVFRSAIRDGKKVRLFLPSRRMRELLEKWSTHSIGGERNVSQNQRIAN